MYLVFFSVVCNCFCHRFWCVRAIGFGFRVCMQLGLILMRACNVQLVLVLVYNRLLFRCVRAIVFSFDLSLVLVRAICLVVTGVFLRATCNLFWCVRAIGFGVGVCMQLGLISMRACNVQLILVCGCVQSVFVSVCGCNCF